MVDYFGYFQAAISEKATKIFIVFYCFAKNELFLASSLNEETFLDWTIEKLREWIHPNA